MPKSKENVRMPGETWDKRMSQEARREILELYFPKSPKMDKLAKRSFSDLPVFYQICLIFRYDAAFQGFPARN